MTPPIIRPAAIPDRLTFLLAAIAAAGAGLVMARQINYGPGLGWDSVVYLSLAQNLLAGDGFIQFTGGYVTFWPPLYPLSLAAASLGLVNPFAIAGPLNAAIFGLTIFITGQYLRQRLQSRFIAIWGCLAVAISVPLVNASAYALSDPLFILMTTLALIQTDKFLHDGKTSSLVWAAVFCALAWQTRYIGGAVPLLTGLLLLFQQGTSLPQKARRVAGFSLLAGLPMALWLLNNYLVAGDLPGNRRALDYYLPGIIADVFGVLQGWACATECAADMSVARWLSVASLLLAAAIVTIAGSVFIREQRGRQSLRQWRPVLIFGGFALIYAVLLVAGIMLGHTHHGVLSHYLAPVYIPLLITAAVVMDQFLPGARDLKMPASVGNLPIIRTLVKGKPEAPGLLTIALVITLSLWAAAQISPNVVQILRANSGDLHLGYSAARWADSETMQYIKENPISGNLYSNESPLVYIHNPGTANYYALPLSRFSEYDPKPTLATGQEQLNQWLARTVDGVYTVGEGAYLVWFNNRWNFNTRDYGAANFRATPELAPVAELSDGVIYRVNRNYDSPTNPYLAAYQSITSGNYGAPAARSGFNLYLNDNSMIYLKEPCYTDDTRKPFSLYLIPANANDLPPHRSQFSSDSLGFSFPDYGLHFNDLCLAIMPLPNYEIARFTTGQHTREQGDLWLVEQDYVPPSSPYQAAYDAIASGEYGEPETRAAFDLYRNGSELIYLKEPCIAADTESLFFLHLYPTDAADLPAHREYDFDALDFLLPQRGARWGGKCLAIAPLPNYQIARIRTGQYHVGGEQIWKAEQYLIDGNPVWRVQPADVSPNSPYQLAYDAIISGGYGEPETRAIFDIYRHDSELIYLKEPCAAADTEALFYLHLYASDAANLPEPRREYRFEALDFPFPKYGVQWAGKCLAIVPLPNHQIARIRTGQYIVGGEQIWKAEQYIIDGSPVWRVQQDDLPPSSPYQMAYNAIASGDYGPPATSGAFDVYRHGNQLVYLKEPCAAADTEARFYLHVYPANPVNLPAQRRPYGFDNPDFQFPQNGVRWSGKCLAIAPLPDHEIARIRTGQYRIGGDRLWTAEFPPAANLTPDPAR